jgi:hypothetical protein
MSPQHPLIDAYTIATTYTATVIAPYWKPKFGFSN